MLICPFSRHSADNYVQFNYFHRPIRPSYRAYSVSGSQGGPGARSEPVIRAGIGPKFYWLEHAGGTFENDLDERVGIFPREFA